MKKKLIVVALVLGISMFPVSRALAQTSQYDVVQAQYQSTVRVLIQLLVQEIAQLQSQINQILAHQVSSSVASAAPAPTATQTTTTQTVVPQQPSQVTAITPQLQTMASNLNPPTTTPPQNILDILPTVHDVSHNLTWLKQPVDSSLLTLQNLHDFFIAYGGGGMIWKSNLGNYLVITNGADPNTNLPSVPDRSYVLLYNPVDSFVTMSQKSGPFYQRLEGYLETYPNALHD